MHLGRRTGQCSRGYTPWRGRSTLARRLRATTSPLPVRAALLSFLPSFLLHRPLPRSCSPARNFLSHSLADLRVDLFSQFVSRVCAHTPTRWHNVCGGLSGGGAHPVVCHSRPLVLVRNSYVLSFRRVTSSRARAARTRRAFLSLSAPKTTASSTNDCRALRVPTWSSSSWKNRRSSYHLAILVT